MEFIVFFLNKLATTPYRVPKIRHRLRSASTEQHDRRGQTDNDARVPAHTRLWRYSYSWADAEGERTQFNTVRTKFDRVGEFTIHYSYKV